MLGRAELLRSESRKVAAVMSSEMTLQSATIERLEKEKALRAPDAERKELQRFNAVIEHTFAPIADGTACARSYEAEHTSAARAAQILTQELFRLGKRAGAVQWSQWRFRSLEDATPQQSPGEVANCGVFMLAAMWCLARCVPIRTVRAEDMGRWRARLALWACLGAVPV